MRVRHVLLALPVLTVAACSVASPAAGSGASPTVAATSAAADVNATVCNQLENYRPRPTTFAEWRVYLNYAQAKIETRGLALKLSERVQALIADVVAYTGGDGGALLNIQTDASKLIAICDGYGVSN